MPLELELENLELEHLPFLIVIQILFFGQLRFEFYNFELNSHLTREFTPHLTSWFSTTKGLDFEKMARDRLILIT